MMKNLKRKEVSKTNEEVLEENISDVTEDGEGVAMTTENEEVTPFDFSKMRSSKSEHKAKTYTGAGVITIIKSEANGKRITVSKEAMDRLGDPTCLQFGFLEDSIVIGENLPDSDIYYTIKNSGSKGIIYSSGLVEEIAEEFSLDFKGGVSKTFGNATYTVIEDFPVVIINMVK